MTFTRNGAGQVRVGPASGADCASGFRWRRASWRLVSSSAPPRLAQGLTFLQSLAMNFFVCSGIAQLVALEIWPHVHDVEPPIVTVAVLAGVVGARLFLMSVAMRPWLEERAGMAGLHGVCFSDRRHLADCHALSRTTGAGTLPRILARPVAIMAGLARRYGCRVLRRRLYCRIPTKYGLDLVMPAFFAAMLVPLWVGRAPCVGLACRGDRGCRRRTSDSGLVVYRCGLDRWVRSPAAIFDEQDRMSADLGTFGVLGGHRSRWRW